MEFHHDGPPPDLEHSLAVEALNAELRKIAYTELEKQYAQHPGHHAHAVAQAESGAQQVYDELASDDDPALADTPLTKALTTIFFSFTLPEADPPDSFVSDVAHLINRRWEGQTNRSFTGFANDFEMLACHLFVIHENLARRGELADVAITDHFPIVVQAYDHAQLPRTEGRGFDHY